MATKRPAHAALFDLDGVLVDTEPVYTRIWSEIDSTFPTGTENFALRIKGTTLPDILANYFPDKSVQKGVCEMLARSEENMEYPLFDGVRSFLRDLKAADIPAAIVTSSGNDKMEHLFASVPDFRCYFVDVITSSRVSRSKPDPEGYILGARSLGVNPADCFVFEDSFNGLRAGRASGATVIALATSNPRQSLVGLADAVIDGFAGFSVSDMLAVNKL